MSNVWIPTIGLEVHVQLKTQRKLFSYSGTEFGKPANSQASYIDLALPGKLPILNRDAVNLAIKLGLALKSDIQRKIRFSRKNYFYPDLPKGYQITQDAYPIIKGGALDIEQEDGSEKTIALVRAHLEEDAGKSIHDGHPDKTGLDFNRAGVTLLEIVTEPQIASAKEAIAFLKKLHALVVYLDVSTGNMQEGAFRCDANVSVRESIDSPLGTRVEIKNLNSFKAIEKAINYEISRQTKLLKNGESITQETRLFNVDKMITKSMRSKENAADYRYFPDPDIPGITIEASTIEAIGKDQPELPWEKCARLIKDYGLSEYDSENITQDKKLAELFEDSCQKTKATPKTIANWVLGDVSMLVNKFQDGIKIRAEDLAHLASLVCEGIVSGTAAKTVLEIHWQKQEKIDDIIDQNNLRQDNDSSKLEELVVEIFNEFPDQLEQYLSGKDKLYAFFVGQAMKKSKGKANPGILNKILKERFNELKSQVSE